MFKLFKRKQYPTAWSSIWICKDCGQKYLGDPLQSNKPCPQCGNCSTMFGTPDTVQTTRRQIKDDQGGVVWEYSGKYSCCDGPTEAVKTSVGRTNQIFRNSTIVAASISII